MVKQENRKECMRFYITNLGKDTFILGYPWFRMFKPTIDWHEGRISGPQIRMETIRYGVLQRARNWVKTIKEDTGNNNNLIVSAICTETPEEALQELENSANPDDILWSGGTPLGIEGGWVEYIWHT